MVWLMATVVFIAGCIGGLMNSVVSGELKLPYRDTEAKVFRPGWVGTVFVGGVAAASSWGLYGPLAQLAIIGGSATPSVSPSLKVAEFFAALVVGFGGGRWLTAELGQIIAIRQRDSLERANKDLVTTVRKLRKPRARKGE